MIDTSAPHRRFNPLSGEWVLVSPQRLARPWQGDEAPAAPPRGPSHDPDCYLCPGNARANGVTNPAYEGVYVFDNDFAVLLPATEPGRDDDPLFRAEAARGTARVVCFSPDHGKTLPDLTDAERRAVIDCWADQVTELGRYWRHVQVFENKGAMMGCSNPHPHGQIWASDHIPDEIAREDAQQRDWLGARGTPLLIETAAREAGGPREVAANDHWIAFVPFWAYWPFELLLVPRAPVARLPELDEARRGALASIIGTITKAYDALFSTSFPYAFGWHGAPHDDRATAHWTLHAHYYPPLLRSATVRKFMASYELLAEPQRDLNAETAAAMLRNKVAA